MGGEEVRQQSTLGRVVWHPVTGVFAAVTLLLAGFVASYLLGRANLAGVLAAACLLILACTFSTSIALLVARRLIVPIIEIQISESASEVRKDLSRVSGSLRVAETHLESLLQSAIGLNEHRSLLTDAQYAALEANSTVREVVIALKQMGNEFQEDLSERDALIDYEGIVINNLRRGVRYTYITEKSSINSARARRVAQRTGALARQVSLVLVPPRSWEKLPFSIDTVFLIDNSGRMDAYMLLPNGADKVSRSWVQMSPDYRDHWWGITEGLLGTSRPISG